MGHERSETLDEVLSYYIGQSGYSLDKFRLYSFVQVICRKRQDTREIQGQRGHFPPVRNRGLREMMIPCFLVALDIPPDLAVHATPDLALCKRLAQQHLGSLQGRFLWYRIKFLSFSMILKEIAVSGHHNGERAMNGSELKPLHKCIGCGSQCPVLPDVFQDLPLLERLS